MICLGEKPDMTLGCGHRFHGACVKKFLATRDYDVVSTHEGQVVVERRRMNSGCPLCRQGISKVDRHTANWKDFQQSQKDKKDRKQGKM